MRKIMHVIAATSVVAMASFSAYGATVEGGAGSVSDILTPKAQAVCDGPFILTAPAMAACSSGQFPTPIKDGSRYTNTGIGAEFNTLIRQLPTVTANTNADTSVPAAN